MLKGLSKFLGTSPPEVVVPEEEVEPTFQEWLQASPFNSILIAIISASLTVAIFLSLLYHWRTEIAVDRTARPAGSDRTESSSSATLSGSSAVRCFSSSISANVINPAGEGSQRGAWSRARPSDVTHGEVSAEASAYENVMTSSDDTSQHQTSSTLTDNRNYKYVDKGDNIILDSEPTFRVHPDLLTGGQYPREVTEVTSPYKGHTSEHISDDDDVFLSPKDVLYVSRSVQAIDPEITSQGQLNPRLASQGHYNSQLTSESQHDRRLTSQSHLNPQQTSQGHQNPQLTSEGQGYFSQPPTSQGQESAGQNSSVVRADGVEGYKIILPKDDSYRVSITCVRLSSQERQAMLEAPLVPDAATPCHTDTRSQDAYDVKFLHKSESKRRTVLFSPTRQRRILSRRDSLIQPILPSYALPRERRGLGLGQLRLLGRANRSGPDVTYCSDAEDRSQEADLIYVDKSRVEIRELSTRQTVVSSSWSSSLTQQSKSDLQLTLSDEALDQYFKVTANSSRHQHTQAEHRSRTMSHIKRRIPRPPQPRPHEQAAPGRWLSEEKSFESSLGTGSKISAKTGSQIAGQKRKAQSSCFIGSPGKSWSRVRKVKAEVNSRQICKTGNAVLSSTSSGMSMTSGIEPQKLNVNVKQTEELLRITYRPCSAVLQTEHTVPTFTLLGNNAQTVLKNRNFLGNPLRYTSRDDIPAIAGRTGAKISRKDANDNQQTATNIHECSHELHELMRDTIRDMQRYRRPSPSAALTNMSQCRSRCGPDKRNNSNPNSYSNHKTNPYTNPNTTSFTNPNPNPYTNPNTNLYTNPNTIPYTNPNTNANIYTYMSLQTKQNRKRKLTDIPDSPPYYVTKVTKLVKEEKAIQGSSAAAFIQSSDSKCPDRKFEGTNPSADRTQSSCRKSTGRGLRFNERWKMMRNPIGSIATNNLSSTSPDKHRDEPIPPGNFKGTESGDKRLHLVQSRSDETDESDLMHKTCIRNVSANRRNIRQKSSELGGNRKRRHQYFTSDNLSQPSEQTSEGSTDTRDLSTNRATSDVSSVHSTHSNACAVCQYTSRLLRDPSKDHGMQETCTETGTMVSSRKRTSNQLMANKIVYEKSPMHDGSAERRSRYFWQKSPLFQSNDSARHQTSFGSADNSSHSPYGFSITAMQGQRERGRARSSRDRESGVYPKNFSLSSETTRPSGCRSLHATSTDVSFSLSPSFVIDRNSTEDIARPPARHAGLTLRTEPSSTSPDQLISSIGSRTDSTVSTYRCAQCHSQLTPKTSSLGERDRRQSRYPNTSIQPSSHKTQKDLHSLRHTTQGDLQSHRHKTRDDLHSQSHRHTTQGDLQSLRHTTQGDLQSHRHTTQGDLQSHRHKTRDDLHSQSQRHKTREDLLSLRHTTQGDLQSHRYKAQDELHSHSTMLDYLADIQRLRNECSPREERGYLSRKESYMNTKECVGPSYIKVETDAKHKLGPRFLKVQTDRKPWQTRKYFAEVCHDCAKESRHGMYPKLQGHSVSDTTVFTSRKTSSSILHDLNKRHPTKAIHSVMTSSLPSSPSYNHYACPPLMCHASPTIFSGKCSNVSSATDLYILQVEQSSAASGRHLQPGQVTGRGIRQIGAPTWKNKTSKFLPLGRILETCSLLGSRSRDSVDSQHPGLCLAADPASHAQHHVTKRSYGNKPAWVRPKTHAVVDCMTHAVVDCVTPVGQPNSDSSQSAMSSRPQAVPECCPLGPSEVPVGSTHNGVLPTLSADHAPYHTVRLEGEQVSYMEILPKGSKSRSLKLSQINETFMPGIFCAKKADKRSRLPMKTSSRPQVSPSRPQASPAASPIMYKLVLVSSQSELDRSGKMTSSSTALGRQTANRKLKQRDAAKGGNRRAENVGAGRLARATVSHERLGSVVIPPTLVQVGSRLAEISGKCSPKAVSKKTLDDQNYFFAKLEACTGPKIGPQTSAGPQKSDSCLAGRPVNKARPRVFSFEHIADADSLPQGQKDLLAQSDSYPTYPEPDGEKQHAMNTIHEKQHAMNTIHEKQHAMNTIHEDAREVLLEGRQLVDNETQTARVSEPTASKELQTVEPSQQTLGLPNIRSEEMFRACVQQFTETLRQKAFRATSEACTNTEQNAEKPRSGLKPTLEELEEVTEHSVKERSNYTGKKTQHRKSKSLLPVRRRLQQLDLTEASLSKSCRDVMSHTSPTDNYAVRRSLKTDDSRKLSSRRKHKRLDSPECELMLSSPSSPRRDTRGDTRASKRLSTRHQYGDKMGTSPNQASPRPSNREKRSRPPKSSPNKLFKSLGPTPNKQSRRSGSPHVTSDKTETARDKKDAPSVQAHMTQKTILKHGAHKSRTERKRSNDARKTSHPETPIYLATHNPPAVEVRRPAECSEGGEASLRASSSVHLSHIQTLLTTALSAQKENREHTVNKPRDNREHSVSKPIDNREHAVSKPIDNREHAVNKPIDNREHSVNKPIDNREHSVNKPIDNREHAVNKPRDNREHAVSKQIDNREHAVSKQIDSKEHIACPASSISENKSDKEIKIQINFNLGSLNPDDKHGLTRCLPKLSNSRKSKEKSGNFIDIKQSNLELKRLAKTVSDRRKLPGNTKEITVPKVQKPELSPPKVLGRRGAVHGEFLSASETSLSIARDMRHFRSRKRRHQGGETLNKLLAYSQKAAGREKEPCPLNKVTRKTDIYNTLLSALLLALKTPEQLKKFKSPTFCGLCPTRLSNVHKKNTSNQVDGGSGEGGLVVTADMRGNVRTDPSNHKHDERLGATIPANHLTNQLNNQLTNQLTSKKVDETQTSRNVTVRTGSRIPVFKPKLLAKSLLSGGRQSNGKSFQAKPLAGKAHPPGVVKPLGEQHAPAPFDRSTGERAKPARRAINVSTGQQRARNTLRRLTVSDTKPQGQEQKNGWGLNKNKERDGPARKNRLGKNLLGKEMMFGGTQRAPVWSSSSGLKPKVQTGPYVSSQRPTQLCKRGLINTPSPTVRDDVIKTFKQAARRQQPTENEVTSSRISPQHNPKHEPQMKKQSEKEQEPVQVKGQPAMNSLPIQPSDESNQTVMTSKPSDAMASRQSDVMASRQSDVMANRQSDAMASRQSDVMTCRQSDVSSLIQLINFSLEHKYQGMKQAGNISSRRRLKRAKEMARKLKPILSTFKCFNTSDVTDQRKHDDAIKERYLKPRSRARDERRHTDIRVGRKDACPHQHTHAAASFSFDVLMRDINEGRDTRDHIPGVGQGGERDEAVERCVHREGINHKPISHIDSAKHNNKHKVGLKRKFRAESEPIGSRDVSPCRNSASSPQLDTSDDVSASIVFGQQSSIDGQNHDRRGLAGRQQRNVITIARKAVGINVFRPGPYPASDDSYF
ncbi:uncharacterized protein LOC131941437 [Physella acuta]|uniref:uncharacterized protein LOC131941437 n=1 Tax=Physella acuta TaxID=109671 RepID=UPI0027DC6857|nr:uncharacterized protein LOC131941437 [Physella acuta]